MGCGVGGRHRRLKAEDGARIRSATAVSRSDTAHNLIGRLPRYADACKRTRGILVLLRPGPDTLRMAGQAERSL